MSGFKQAAPGPEFLRPETKPKFRPISPAGGQIPKITCGTSRLNAGFSRKVSVIRDSGNCVVGPGGLEPPTNRLWGESPDVIFRLDFLVRKSVHAIRA